MAKSFNEYRLQTAEMWRGVNCEISAIRAIALDRMQNAIANGSCVSAIQKECEQIRAWERMRTTESIQTAMRAEAFMQSTDGWTE